MIGETLSGKYEIRQLLGSGSLTSVYLARDAQQGRMVAVKVLLQHFAADPEMVERFLDAARKSQAIKHKHVVQVLQVGRDEWKEAPYLVMELLRGRTLEEALAKAGPLPAAEAVRLMGQVLAAIGAAHARGIVHADLRPGHAFLYAAVGGPESVKVFDFGLARVLAPSTGRRPSDDRTPRTPHALSPEWLADGGKVDARSDIFAAGAMLHVMITGQLPLGFQTMPDLVRAVTEGASGAGIANEPGIGPGLGAAIAKALDKDPTRRFQSAEDMAQAIAEAPAAPARFPPPPRMMDQKSVAPPPGQYTGADLVSWDEDAPDTAVEPVPVPAAEPAPAGGARGKDLDETPTGVRAALEAGQPGEPAAGGKVEGRVESKAEAEAREEEEALSAPTLPPPRPPKGAGPIPQGADLGKVDDWGALPLPEIEPPSIEELEAASAAERATRPPEPEEEVEEAEEIEEIEEVEELEELEEEAEVTETNVVEPVGLVEPPGGFEQAPGAGDTSIGIFLEAVDGPCRGTICPVPEAGIVVGRAKDADISVMDPVVSRRHAKFRLENGTVVVEDMGSSFGTWVNGEKVPSARIKPGDKVAVGASVFVVNYPGRI